MQRYSDGLTARIQVTKNAVCIHVSGFSHPYSHHRLASAFAALCIASPRRNRTISRQTVAAIISMMVKAADRSRVIAIRAEGDCDWDVANGIVTGWPDFPN